MVHFSVLVCGERLRSLVVLSTFRADQMLVDNKLVPSMILVCIAVVSPCHKALFERSQVTVTCCSLAAKDLPLMECPPFRPIAQISLKMLSLKTELLFSPDVCLESE